MDIFGVKQRYEERLMALPNVVAVGFGKKCGELVIKVFVEGTRGCAMNAGGRVPATIEGFEVVTEEIGAAIACA